MTERKEIILGRFRDDPEKACDSKRYAHCGAERWINKQSIGYGFALDDIKLSGDGLTIVVIMSRMVNDRPDPYAKEKML